MKEIKFQSPIVFWLSDYTSWKGSKEYMTDADIDKLNNILKGEEDLAQYVPKELSFIKSIKLQVFRNPEAKDSNASLLIIVEIMEHIVINKSTNPNKIIANRRLIGQIEDYLTGQFSDGWGEGFEQQEFASWKETIEDDENGEYEEKITQHVSFWDKSVEPIKFIQYSVKNENEKYIWDIGEMQ